MIFALAITGPTASGKTGLSIELAERLSGEIISSDSMQIYKKMNIGTAKPTKEEQSRVPHHLIDFLSPRENFSAESYRVLAMEKAREISERGRLPIFVGGTGLYIDSVIRGSSPASPESDPEYREALLLGAESEEGIDALWQRLNAVDPESAEKIHKNNVKRVIRALEVYDKTGIPKSELDKQTQVQNSEIRIGMITLDFHDRENLYERVNRRVDQMLEDGLLSETEELYREGLLDGASTASQAIGYKELLSYIKGECELPDALEELKTATRRYAKRQLTWFRHESEAKRLFLDREDGELRPAEEITEEAMKLSYELLSENR